MATSSVKRFTTPLSIFMVLIIIISIFINSACQSEQANKSKKLIIAEENADISPLTALNKYPIYNRISNEQQNLKETSRNFLKKNDPPVVSREIFTFPLWSRGTFT